MLLFHGTTVENAKRILENGFSYDSSVWNCSEDKTYFFTENFVRDQMGDDECLLSRESVIEEGVRIAMQQSRITLAVQNPSDYRGCVLVFDSSLMANEAELEEDYSCDNMDKTAVCVNEPDMNGLISVYEMIESEAAYRFFELSGYLDNNYSVELELTSDEITFIQELSKSSVCCGYYDLVNYKEYKQIFIAKDDLEAA